MIKILSIHYLSSGGYSVEYQKSLGNIRDFIVYSNGKIATSHLLKLNGTEYKEILNTKNKIDTQIEIIKSYLKSLSNLDYKKEINISKFDKLNTFNKFKKYKEINFIEFFNKIKLLEV